MTKTVVIDSITKDKIINFASTLGMTQSKIIAILVATHTPKSILKLAIDNFLVEPTEIKEDDL